MRKISHITILGAMLPLAASCAMGELPAPEDQDCMLFSPNLDGYTEVLSKPSTKAVETDGLTLYLHSYDEPMTALETKSAPATSVHSTFGACGYQFPIFDGWNDTFTPDLFFNKKVTKSGSSWTFSDGEEIRWPGATYGVRVLGWSPYDGATLTSTASTAGAPVISHTVSTTVASQTDLLEGVSDADAADGIQDYAGAGGSDIAMSFRHALAGIKVTTSDFGFAGTLKSVTISNIYSKGEHALMSDTWTGQTTKATYAITPGASVPASDALIYGDAMTVLAIPQTCPADAEMTIVFTQGGKDYTLTASLAGKVLSVNTITSFVLSLDAESVASGIVTSTLAEFTNTTSSASQTLNIKSYTIHSSGLTKAEPWTVSGYSLDGGSTWTTTKPDWLSLSATSGSGSTTGESVTVTLAARSASGGTGKIFVPSDAEDVAYNAALKGKPEIGTQSSPIDLSMRDYLGNETATGNTANCYVVHGPGWYKIPLVYGNAIKNGETNTSAFHNETAGTSFEDSWGTVFTASSSPYVKDHASAAGTSLANAELLWVDTACGVDNVSSDGDHIFFHIPAETIEQTNMLLAVRDGNGDVAWSWHVWVTGRDLSPVTITNSSSVSFNIMPVALGWNGFGTEGTKAVYPARSCLIRFKLSNGTYQKAVAVSSPEAPASGGSSGSTARSSAPYFQWGRKDPFISLGAPTSGGNIEYSSSAGAQSQAHQNPKVHYYSSSSYSWTTDQFNYFWDADNTATSTDSHVVKTIYDPCPAGWNVPQYNTFTYFSTSNVVGSFNKGWTFKKNSGDATVIFFPAAGYRIGSSASVDYVASGGYWWLSVPGNPTSGYSLNFDGGYVGPRNFSDRSYGYCVWPALSQN